MADGAHIPDNPAMDEHDLFSDRDQAEHHHEMIAARRAAIDLLNLVLDQKQALDHSLERAESFRALPARDKAFCRMIVSTTLRRLGQIDDLITRAQHRSSTKTPTLTNILRIGVTQIFFMDVPDHAAVDTSVRLTEAAGMDKQKGFVNGLLRTLIREGREWVTKQDAPRLNTPEWLLKMWIADYGMREAATIAQANMNEAPLDITIKDEGDRQYYQSHFTANEIGTGTLRLQPGGPITEREGFTDGRWWVQDASAAMPANLFGDVSGQTVLDICAAPGGKTMQLAAKGAHVIALDRSAQRLKRLSENLERVHLQNHVHVEVADATVWQSREPIKYILVDAPCSATGTMRRNPDVVHLKVPQDLERLQSVQERILDNAFNVLAPGGVMIYCTCSIQKSEGEEQIARFFERHQNAYKSPISAQEIGGIDEAINEDGDVRLLPYHRDALGGMDGFFIARITKQ